MVNMTTPKVTFQDSTSDYYGSLTIAALAELIVNAADRAARDELLSRRVCAVNGERLSVPEYLLSLKDCVKLPKYASVMLIEGAFDRTLSKFFSFPGDGNGHVNCRCYYRPFLKYVEPLICGKDFMEQERIAANKLRSFIYRQFRWSLCDAMRKANGFSKTYQWKISDLENYKVQMPSVMTGKQCKKFLEENIGQSDTKNVSTQQDIQHIIDEQLFVPSMIPLGADCFDTFASQTTISPLEQLIESETKDNLQLSLCIANEKADNLDSVRISIARIGRDKVRKLVVAIFDAIDTANYRPSVLGREFGVSPAAMTRFASLKWDTENAKIPQLWQNVARYVVHLPQYSKMLYETGLYDTLSSMVLED